MKTKHTTVFPGRKEGEPQKVFIATLAGKRLGERVSPIVLAEFTGNLSKAVSAYNRGDSSQGEKHLFNLA